MQLRTCTQDEVPAWAERWWINAPCVVEQARAIVERASHESDPPDIEVWKKCTCDGDRCRHHYVYRFGLRGNDYFGQDSSVELRISHGWSTRRLPADRACSR